MKNLIAAVIVMMSTGAFSQNSWTDQEKYNGFEKVHVEGIDSVWVKGDWSITALNTSYAAFEEVVSEGIRVLEANGIKFKDQFYPEGSFDFTSVDQMQEAYNNIIYGGSISACWRISNNDEVSTLAFLFLETTGFRFMVVPNYVK